MPDATLVNSLQKAVDVQERTDSLLEAVKVFDEKCLHADQIDEAWAVLSAAGEAWSEAVATNAAGRLAADLCPEAESIRSFIHGVRDFVRVTLIPRMNSVARRALAAADNQPREKVGKIYQKVTDTVKEKVLAVSDASRDLYDTAMDAEPPAELALAVGSERAVVLARMDWRALVGSVRAAEKPEEVPPGEPVMFTFSDTLEAVDQESQSWPEAAAELSEICGETVDLLLESVKTIAEIAQNPADPGPRAELSRFDQSILDNLAVTVDYLAGIRMKKTDDKKKSKNAQDELKEFEQEYSDLLEDLQFALEDQDSEEATDVTARMLDHTLQVLSAAEQLSLSMPPESKEELIEKIERLFLITERQASNTQALAANPRNSIAQQRLDKLSGEMRRAVSAAIGAMTRARDNIPEGEWIDAFNEWRDHVLEERRLTAELRQIDEAVANGAPPEAIPNVEDIKKELAAATAGRAKDKESWSVEYTRRRAVDELKLEHERADRQVARNSRKTEYDVLNGKLLREDLSTKKLEEQEIAEEIARQERARERELMLQRLKEEEEADRIRKEQEAIERAKWEAEEAVRKAAEEARRLVEEAKRLEEDAKRAEEEAKRLAEEEAAAELRREAGEELDGLDGLDDAETDQGGEDEDGDDGDIDMGDDEEGDPHEQPGAQSQEDGDTPPGTDKPGSRGMMVSASDPGLIRSNSRVLLERIASQPAVLDPNAPLKRQPSRIVLERLATPPTPQPRVIEPVTVVAGKKTTSARKKALGPLSRSNSGRKLGGFWANLDPLANGRRISMQRNGLPRMANSSSVPKLPPVDPVKTRVSAVSNATTDPKWAARAEAIRNKLKELRASLAKREESEADEYSASEKPLPPPINPEKQKALSKKLFLFMPLKVAPALYDPVAKYGSSRKLQSRGLPVVN